MNSWMVIYTAIFGVIALVLMTFAVFAIGFLLGYKIEERKIKKANVKASMNQAEENYKQEKSMKEWKNFLEYDGSIPET